MISPQPCPQDLATTLNTLDAQSADILESLKLMHDIYTFTRDTKERSELCLMYYEVSSGSMIDTLIKIQENVDKVTVDGLVAMYKTEGINDSIVRNEVKQIVTSLREKFVKLNMEVENMTQWIKEGVA